MCPLQLSMHSINHVQCSSGTLGERIPGLSGRALSIFVSKPMIPCFSLLQACWLLFPGPRPCMKWLGAQTFYQQKVRRLTKSCCFCYLIRFFLLKRKTIQRIKKTKNQLLMGDDWGPLKTHPLQDASPQHPFLLLPTPHGFFLGREGRGVVCNSRQVGTSQGKPQATHMFRPVPSVCAKPQSISPF